MLIKFSACKTSLSKKVMINTSQMTSFKLEQDAFYNLSGGLVALKGLPTTALSLDPHSFHVS